MDRKEKTLKHIRKNGIGIEIGPSHNPIAPKKDGFNVQIIDVKNRDDLVKGYKGHNVNTDNIEEVDFIWDGQSFSELTGQHKHYDWIIASHVIEHTPDLIGFLNNCEAILKDDGVISLAIPDKRYCFDHYRPITGISKILDSHFQKNKTHTPGALIEYHMNVVLRKGAIAWDSNTTGEYKTIHPLEGSYQRMNQALNEKKYIDTHAWCFVPHSLRLLIHDLSHLKQIHLQEIDFYPTEGCEFHMTLGKQGKGSGLSRLKMLEAIEDEIKYKTNILKLLKIKNIRILKRLTRYFT